MCSAYARDWVGAGVLYVRCRPALLRVSNLYASGNLPLRSLLPFLQAESELQALSAIVSFILLALHLLTTCMVRERVLLKSANIPRPSLKNEFREIYKNARTPQRHLVIPKVKTR